MGWSRYYPKSSFTWRFYREHFLGRPWSEVKPVLKQRRYKGFSRRLQDTANWWWVKYWTKRYCELLSGPFCVRDVPEMGLGVFTVKPVKKGSLVLFGHLNRISQKVLRGLEDAGESSLMLLPDEKKDRCDWYYLSGPASLLNHRCRKFNAEYVFGQERGKHGEFLVRIKKNLAPGEEVLVHYGDEYWTDREPNRCLCKDCTSD